MAFEDCTRERGKVTEWSKASRRRMMYRLATLDWGQLRGIPEMITLTYPGDWRSCAPDGATVKRHLDNLWRSWADKWGHRPDGVWKLEFQRRGAPHIHAYVGRPMIEPDEFRSWLSHTWARIVDSGDPLHVLAGTGVDSAFAGRATSIRRIARYFTAHGLRKDKEYQHQVPAGFDDVGRFWGITGRLRPDVDTTTMTVDDFVQVRRVLRGIARSKGLRKTARARGGLTGMWVLLDDAVRVAIQLGCWLQGEREHVGGVRLGFASANAPPPAVALAAV